jgi:hypothetical protein
MSVKVNLRKIPNSAACSVTVKQFPMVPCFACTTEKLQGQTCGKGIIISGVDSGQNTCPPQTLCVTLSRTISLRCSPNRVHIDACMHPHAQSRVCVTHLNPLIGSKYPSQSFENGPINGLRYRICAREFVGEENLHSRSVWSSFRNSTQNKHAEKHANE